MLETSTAAVGDWRELLVVLGYVSFAAFIAWRVFMTKQQ